MTFAGWLLGIITALILSPLVNSITGKYLVQSPLPISMCAVIGLFQSILLRKYHTKSSSWFWIYFFSFLICFTSIETVFDLVGVKPELYIPFAAVISALLTGYLQARFFFRIKGRQAIRWTMRTVFAWFASVAVVFTVPLIASPAARQVSMILYMLTIVAGGLILGYLTKNVSGYLHERGNESLPFSVPDKKRVTTAETT